MNNTLALIKPDAMQKGFKDEIRKFYNLENMWSTEIE